MTALAAAETFAESTANLATDARSGRSARLAALRSLQSLPGVRTARQLSRPQPTYPVVDALGPVLAHGGLPRGQAIGVTGGHALTVALAAATHATTEGSWCVTVGVGEPSVAACLDLGMDLDHYVNVQAPGADWLRAVSILVESVDIVIARPPFRLTGTERQRLLAKVRERRMSLILLGGMPGTAETLSTGTPAWHGTHHGTGRLRACTVRVDSDHTGGHELLLPGPDGRIAAAPAAPVTLAGLATTAPTAAARRATTPAAASPVKDAGFGQRPRLVVHDGC